MDPKKKPRSMRCMYCGGAFQLLDSTGWEALLQVPWCPACNPRLWDVVEKPITPQTYYDAYVKIYPKETLRAERLEVELGMIPPCHCNNCH